MFRGWARGGPPGTVHLYRIRHSMEVARGTVRVAPRTGRGAKKKPGAGPGFFVTRLERSIS